MTLEELKEKLDELAWDEQVAFEMGERYPDAVQSDKTALEAKIRELGRHLTPALLDALEGEGGYLTWVLRLSPYVPGDRPMVRAQRVQEHEDSDIRYWAAQLLEGHEQ